MKIYLFKFALICVVAAISSTSCGQPAPDKAKAARVSTNTKITTGSFDSLQIGVFFKKHPLLTNSPTEVVDFYRKRNFEYAWFYNSILVEQAGNLATRILNFKSDGLGTSSPYQYVLDSLLNQSKLNGGGGEPQLELEIMLTAQYFKFSKAAIRV